MRLNELPRRQFCKKGASVAIIEKEEDGGRSHGKDQKRSSTRKTSR